MLVRHYVGASTGSWAGRSARCPRGDGPVAQLPLAGEHPRAAERAEAGAVAGDRPGGHRGIPPRARLRTRRPAPARSHRAGGRLRKVGDRVVPPPGVAGLRSDLYQDVHRQSTSSSCRWCSNPRAEPAPGGAAPRDHPSDPRLRLRDWAWRSPRRSRRPRATTSTESPCRQRFLSWRTGRGRRTASPRAWSVVDHAGQGRDTNPVLPPSADRSGGATPSVVSRLLLPRYHFGRHSFDRTHRSGRSPEPGFVRELKSRDREVAPSSIRRIGRNHGPNPAPWRAGCNAHPTLRHVTTTGRTESPTRDRIPIVPLSISLADALT